MQKGEKLRWKESQIRVCNAGLLRPCLFDDFAEKAVFRNDFSKRTLVLHALSNQKPIAFLQARKQRRKRTRVEKVVSVQNHETPLHFAFSLEQRVRRSLLLLLAHENQLVLKARFQKMRFHRIPLEPDYHHNFPGERIDALYYPLSQRLLENAHHGFGNVVCYG